MEMPGRPPLTPEQHALQGTERRVTVPNVINLAVQGGRPKCPRHLSKAARKEWMAIVKLLESRSVLDPGAGNTLELWATTKARWLEAKQDLETRGLMLQVQKATSKGELYMTEAENPMLAISEKCEAQLIQLTKALGIEPASREKVKKVKTVARAANTPAWLVNLHEKEKTNGPDDSEG
jgi:P27 family predicted phage terminase small subunit